MEQKEAVGAFGNLGEYLEYPRVIRRAPRAIKMQKNTTFEMLKTHGLVVSAGHTPSSWGASGPPGSGLKEHEVAWEYALELFQRGVAWGIPCWLLPRDMPLRTKLEVIRMYNPESIALDIHLNAFNGKAHGTEVFYRKGSLRGYSLGRTLLDATVSFGFRNRGMKLENQSARGRLGFISSLSCGIIMELCFMDNPQDLLLLDKMKPETWVDKIEELLGL